MKTSFPTRLLSCLLAAAMLFTMFPVSAGAANGNGKYIKDVYIAYGETKAEAEKWLRENEDWMRQNANQIPVLKWKTDIWGEIPADYGRK